MEQFVNLIQWKFRVVPFNYHYFCISGKQILYFVLWMFRNQHIEGGIPGHMYHNKCTVFGCQAYCKHKRLNVFVFKTFVKVTSHHSWYVNLCCWVPAIS